MLLMAPAGPAARDRLGVDGELLSLTHVSMRPWPFRNDPEALVAILVEGKIAEGLPALETGSSPSSAPATAPYWSSTVPPSGAGVTDPYPTESAVSQGRSQFFRHHACPDVGRLSIGS
jgi:hypothetical protein